MNIKSLSWAPIFFFGVLSHAQVTSHTPSTFQPAPSSGPTASAQTRSVKPVVRVNGSVLTDADLLREEYAIFPYARQHNGVPKELGSQIRDGAMKMMIFEELVYQEALRRKMTVAAPKLERALSDFRKQFATPEEFNAFVQGEFHGSQPLMVEKIRRSLLIDAFLQSEVESKCAVSAAELKAFYDQNPARFERPEMFTFQSISVLPPQKATAQQLKEGQERAQKALTQARATKSAEEFGLLAEKISDDDYRVMMGQHKPVAADELPPQVVKALGAMKAGDVSAPIQVDQAWTILRLQEHKPAGKAKLEEVKAKLEKDLQETKRNQLRSALDARLRAGARIEGM